MLVSSYYCLLGAAALVTAILFRGPKVGLRWFRRGQLAVPWAILFTGLMLAFVLMSMKLTILYLHYHKYLHDEYEMQRWAVGQHLSLVNYEFIPAGVGKYRLRVTLVNDGQYPVKIGYAEVCLRYVAKRLKAYYCAWLDTNVTIETSKQTGPFILPTEQVTITTSKTLQLWQALTYTPQVTIIDPTTLNTITVTIPVKTSTLEITAYAEGLPAKDLDVKLFRLGPEPLSGSEYEFFSRNPMNQVMGYNVSYLELSNIIPGKYLAVITFKSVRGKSYERAIPITLKPNQVMHLHLDIPRKPSTPINTSSSSWSVDFSDLPLTQIYGMIEDGFFSFFGDFQLSTTSGFLGNPPSSRFSDYGVVFVQYNSSLDYPNITLVFRTPAMGGGPYVISLSGTEYNYLINNVTILVDGKPVKYVRNETEIELSNYYSVYDYLITANVTFEEVAKHVIEFRINFVRYESGAWFSITRFSVTPFIARENLVVRWVGTLWPGDVLELRNNKLSKVSSGLVRYLPCDNASTTPNYYPHDSYWLWSGDNSVRNNATFTWLWFNPSSERTSATLNFTINCPSSSCTVYAWAYPPGYLGPLTNYYVLTQLVVDNKVRDQAWAQSSWQLLKARDLGVGKHEVAIIMNLIHNTEGQALQPGIDEILVVKSPYINITGLEPGYRVVITDLRTNAVVYQVRATSNTLIINAEEIGIVYFPMRAEVLIYKYPTS